MIEDEDIEIEDTQREDRHDLMMRLLMWREKHINEHNFVLILSFIIGICTAAAALILKFLIHFIQQLLTSHFNADSANYLYLIYPIIGILLAGLYVRYIVKDDISHGVTRILYAISQKKSRLKPHNMYTSVIASSITIGFGGSVGAEAPIVYTGAAIGSNIGRLFRLDQRLLMLLVGCGAAAAIAGIFKAPIAGILFTLEVLMIDMTATSVLPLLISSITAVTVSYIFTGYNAEFSFVETEPFVAARIPYVIFLGFFCGFVSLYFTRIMNRMEDIFRRIGTPWKKFILGSLILSCSIFLLPPLYGEGYGAITSLLNDNLKQLAEGSLFYTENGNMWVMMLFLGLIILVKVLATSATNGGGGVGGTFAPSLYVGCFATEGAWRDMAPYHPTAGDVLIGIAASGTTPYVIGGLRAARRHGLLTGSITCNPASPVAAEAEYALEAVVGPEFVTGSTRMKAGTAQKLMLNMLSTAVMIRLGRVEGNRMVNMQLTNDKLVARGTRMVAEASGLDETEARELLLRWGSVKRALEEIGK